MIRRLMSVLLLATMVAAQALPGAAGAMVCGMEGPGKAVSGATQGEDCTRCVAGSVESARATLAAASCCRFGAPPEIATPSAVVSSSQRTVTQGATPAVCVAGTAHAYSNPESRSATAHGPVRSTSPPPSSTTTLRL